MYGWMDVATIFFKGLGYIKPYGQLRIHTYICIHIHTHINRQLQNFSSSSYALAGSGNTCKVYFPTCPSPVHSDLRATNHKAKLAISPSHRI